MEFWSEMGVLIFQSNINLGEYLSRSWFSFLKSIIFCSSRDNAPKPKNRITNSGTGWHNLPGDIIGMIGKCLTHSDRIRLSCVCKWWRVILMNKDICPTAPEIPWLMLLQFPIGKHISFYSLCDERVYNLRLPQSAHGVWCCGSSKGWLVMIVNPSDSDPQLFLLNPISETQLQLPSLKNMPPFANSQSNILNFIDEIKVSSADAVECIVAVSAFLNDDRILALCRPDDESWQIFQGWDECVARNEDGQIICADILFLNGTLYILVISEEPRFATCTTKLSDCEVMLKFISFPYNFYKNVEVQEVVEFPHFKIFKNHCAYLNLAESTGSELLIIAQLIDQYALKDDQNIGVGYEHQIGHGHEEGDEYEYYYPQDYRYRHTSGFEVFKFNPSDGHFDRLNSLGDERVLFLTDGDVLSFSTKDHNQIHGNCIYFVKPNFRKSEKKGLYFSKEQGLQSRECGVFYVEKGRIERPFPSMKPGEGMRWYTANF